MAQHAVEQSRHWRGVATCIAHQRADALAVQPQPRQGRHHRGGRFGLGAGAHRAAEQVQRQRLGPLRRRLRDGVQLHPRGEPGQSESFIRHRRGPVF